MFNACARLNSLFEKSKINIDKEIENVLILITDINIELKKKILDGKK